MKKLITMLIFIALASNCLGTFTTSINSPKTYKNAYRWTGKSKDYLLDWAQEVEGSLSGTTGLAYSMWTATDTEPGTTAGMWYYDLSENKPKYYNGSGWIAVEAGSSGNSLDGAYDIGSAITVDDGAVTMTATNAADNVALAVVQSDTGATVGQTITSAGTGALLSLDSNGTGADILGSDSTWTITKAGAATLVGATTTGELIVSAADVLFDDTYDVAWDTSRDTLLFQDSAVLGLGGAHDAAADTWFIHDGSNLSLLSLIADEGFLIGGTAAGFDVTYAFETAGQIRTDYDADFLNFTDDMDLRFGTGASADGDFQISSNSSNVLAFEQVAANTGTITFGADGTDIPTKWFGETAGDFIQITGDDVQIEDMSLCLAESTQLQFGDALGTGDFQISSTTNVLTVGQIVAGTGEVRFGVNDAGLDVKLFGDTASAYLLWDTSEDTLSHVGGNATFTTDDTEADQFKVNATGAVAGDAINFKTTDGGIMLNADGANGGDIELNSADDLIITSAGKVTITNTEAVTISGALTTTGVNTSASAIVASGIQDVAAGGTTTALTVATKSVFTVGADAGGDIMTIVNGTAGQVIYIICEDATGTVTVTPATFGGGTSITFNAVGDAVTLVYTAGTGWNIVGGNSYSII